MSSCLFGLSAWIRHKRMIKWPFTSFDFGSGAMFILKAHLQPCRAKPTFDHLIFYLVLAKEVRKCLKSTFVQLAGAA